MTNKINGIDVSEWELKGVLITITECKYFEGIGDCKESKGLCVDNDNCYFKQLKRLQEENEKLRQDWRLDCLKCEYKNTKADVDKYKQALEEIREIAKYSIMHNSKLNSNYQIILQNINEALNDRD